MTKTFTVASKTTGKRIHIIAENTDIPASWKVEAQRDVLAGKPVPTSQGSPKTAPEGEASSR